MYAKRMDQREPVNYIPLGIRRRLLLLLAFCGLLALPACGEMELEPLPTIAVTADPVPEATPVLIPTQAQDATKFGVSPVPNEQKIVSDSESIAFQPLRKLIDPYLDEEGNLIANIPYEIMGEPVSTLLNSVEYVAHSEEIESQIPEELMNSLVLITLFDSSQNVFGYCSGVNIGFDEATASYHVITAGHCAGNIDAVSELEQNDPNQFINNDFIAASLMVSQAFKEEGLITNTMSLEGNVLYNATLDLAIIRIHKRDVLSNTPESPSLRIGQSNFEQHYFGGFPYFTGVPLFGSAVSGPSLNVGVQQTTFPTINNSGHFWPCMSGGPVFGPDGTLEGTIISIFAGTGLPPVGIYTPLNDDLIRNLIDQLNDK